MKSGDNVVVNFPGGGGGEGRRPGSPVQWREFERLPTGAIIERRYDKDGNEKLVGVLSLDVRVLRVEQLEDTTDDDDRRCRTRSAGGVRGSG